MEKKRKLLIVGCGRSGTKYISELLKKNGFDVGHEQDGTDGIASWPMTITDGEDPPWGPSFREYKFDAIVHQVRNPVKVISSCHTILDKSWNYIKKYIPIKETDSKLIMCAKYWYYWNLRAENLANFTYRIEDIDSTLPKLLKILRGKDYPSRLLDVSRDVNRRPHCLISLEKVGREEKELYDKIINLSLRYGYKKEELSE